MVRNLRRLACRRSRLMLRLALVEVKHLRLPCKRDQPVKAYELRGQRRWPGPPRSGSCVPGATPLAVPLSVERHREWRFLTGTGVNEPGGILNIGSTGGLTTAQRVSDRRGRDARRRRRLGSEGTAGEHALLRQLDLRRQPRDDRPDLQVHAGRQRDRAPGHARQAGRSWVVPCAS